MNKITVGLLPLYLKLYDDTSPEHRPGVERFRDTIQAALEQRGLSVTSAPVCRVAGEFTAAVRAFEQAGADAIVTLHLAYSPSEESAPALAASPLPVIVLDTTPAFDFGPQQNPDEIMYNHGIHGVQDLCNLLIRHRKPFQIEVGHWEHSDVLDRVVIQAQAARLVNALRSARVGAIGGAFKGMGDFSVPQDRLHATLGVTTVPVEPATIASLMSSISEKDIESETATDMAFYTSDGITPEAYRLTVCASLAVRQWIEREHLTAFSMNFMEVTRAAGMPTVPFLEASKAMARGIGYAGEGDTLTAALVGALASVFGRVSFTEMFCPDWANDSIFLSHMGEMNVNLIAGKPRLVQKSYAFLDSNDVVLAVGRFQSGQAVFVNLAPGMNDQYTLILAPVHVQDVNGKDEMADSIHGWIKPDRPLADFLQRYSQVGGTHHAALVYGDCIGQLVAMGEMLGWKVVTI